MTRYTPEQIAAGARVSVEHARNQMGLPPFTERQWKIIKTLEVPAFTAGVATLPDHTAELLEALERLYNACEYQANQEGGDLGPIIGPSAEHADQVIANAKAQIKGGDHA